MKDTEIILWIEKNIFFNDREYFGQIKIIKQTLHDLKEKLSEKKKACM